MGGRAIPLKETLKIHCCLCKLIPANNFYEFDFDNRDMTKLKLFKTEAKKRVVLTAGYIEPDSTKCVQCGICSYNCPIGIDVRTHVWRREPMKNNQCLACGECIARCPRGVLQFVTTDIFSKATS